MQRLQPPFLSSLTAWVLPLAFAAGILMFGATPRARAADQDACHRRIAHAEHDLHEAIEHHGRQSPEAVHERHELQEAREHCWQENHRWWDEHERRWHQERDWDEHDHDRDDYDRH